MRRFIDRVRIKVSAGNGGRGSVSFRREKYVPRGGPDGGDGGRGGSVFFEVDEQVETLVDFSYHPLMRADGGVHGQGKNKKGKDGDDVIVKVPPGTVVSDVRTGRVLADLVRPGQSFRVVRGGMGGRGNARFATPEHRSPMECEPGQLGGERSLNLELRLIADAGLIGLPNAGKSSLLSRLTSARPEVASYPFTTRRPFLGVAELDGGRRVRLADLPGLIEGAHEGRGLGLEFLRHATRTKVLVHVVDVAGVDGRRPEDDVAALETEIESYGSGLAACPRLVVANKIDLQAGKANLPGFREAVGGRIVAVSALTGEGMEELKRRLAELVEARDG